MTEGERMQKVADVSPRKQNDFMILILLWTTDRWSSLA